ncbi:MAG: FtsX-like permease family protein [Synechococcus sp.]
MVVSGFVVLVGLSGMLVALLTGFNERRREMAILRSVGARPVHIFGLIVGEACVLTVVGILTGITLLYAGLWIARPILLAKMGLAIAIGGFSGIRASFDSDRLRSWYCDRDDSRISQLPSIDCRWNVRQTVSSNSRSDDRPFLRYFLFCCFSFYCEVR